MTLALKYRPQRFEDLVGQKVSRLILQRMVAQGAVPPALLFTGPRGTGKTTTARILAAALNCEAATKPCGVCPQCRAVFATTSTDVLEIDAASNGLVADIRKLREQVLYSSAGEWRVILLDEAHSMSREAFHALLKTLEEPPPNCVFVLLTTEPGKIIDTVVSRCWTLEFRRLGVRDITDRLAQVCAAESITAEADLLAEIAQQADGGLRDALMLLDQVSQVGVRTVAQLRQVTGDVDFAPGLLECLTRGDLAAAYAEVEEALQRLGDPGSVTDALSRLVRDCFVLVGNGELHLQGEALEARQRLCGVLSPVQLLKVAQVLWELKARVRVNDRAGLEIALPLIAEALGAVASLPSTQGPANGHRRLSLDEMRASVQ